RPLRPHETPRLIHTERLRVHPDELGRDGDHVDRPVVHQACLRRYMTMAPVTRAATRRIPIQPPMRPAVLTPFQRKIHRKNLLSPPIAPTFAAATPPPATTPPAVLRPSLRLFS